MRIIHTTACALLLACGAPAAAQDDPLYEWQDDGQPRWTSPENRSGQKGAGGTENKGAKGRAFETIAAGGNMELANILGAGIIDRMWITVNDRSPEMLRALRLDIYWDGASKPAVSAPLGDFFGGGAGALVAMETALVSSPEGRSFVSEIPMPFAKGARIVVTNESAKELPLIFWDVNYRTFAKPDPDHLYFHAYWGRDRATEPGKAFELLPRIQGKGRYLGAIVTTFTHPDYGKTWWGEGEVKVFLDGDRALPTLVGTGTEDYIGTGWGQGVYAHRHQGSPVADEPSGRWTYYRFHVPDPIFFSSEARVELQQIGGAPKPKVIEMVKSGIRMTPVTIDPGRRPGFAQLLTTGQPVTAPGLPDGWTNFYRSDDVSTVTFFYLDQPMSNLPELAPVAERVAALRPPSEAKKTEAPGAPAAPGAP